jgi:hypothetical protein
VLDSAQIEEVCVLVRVMAAMVLAGIWVAAGAQTGGSPVPTVQGKWVMATGKRNVMVLTIESGKAGQTVSGTLASVHFQTADGATFSHVHGPVRVEAIVASAVKNDGVELTVQDAADASDKDMFLFTVKDGNQASLQMEGTPIPPFAFTRAQGAAVVATDWDESKTYSPDDGMTSNAEMRKIFEEDQRVRQNGFAGMSKEEGKKIWESDEERRVATKKLLAAGALHTAEDFTWAAFLFQHGSAPEDYLLAHTLAMVAVKKGAGDAIWIASATLDRYLQAIGKPQIYGTQFRYPKNEAVTQEPYDRDLISDPLRRQLGVPGQAAQESERKGYEAERMKATK